MYRIYADDDVIYDSTIDDQRIEKGELTLELGKSGSFSMSIYSDHPAYDTIVKMKTIIKITRDGKIIFRGRVLNDSTDYWGLRTLTSEGELSFLQDTIMRPYTFKGTPEELFNKIINNHNEQADDAKKFNVGRITVKDSNDYISRKNTAYDSSLANIKSRLLEDATGGYIIIDHNDGKDTPTINYLSQYDGKATQTVEFGKNLKDFVKSSKGDDLATAVIPLGAKIEETDADGNTVTDSEKRTTIESVNDGKDYIYDSNAASIYGMIYKTAEFNDVHDPSILLKRGQSYLSASVNLAISIELKAIDLHLLDRSIEAFNIGDYIRVISEPHNFDATMLCTKQTIDLLKPDGDTLTLGYAYATLTDAAAKNASAIRHINEMSTSVTKATADAEKALENYTKIIKEIGTTSGDVSSTATAVTENARNIAKNTASINSNKNDIATNASNIASNTQKINANTDSISTLSATVSKNSADIKANTASINTNADSIAANASRITAAENAIASDAARITANTSAISSNSDKITANANSISANAARIETNTENISSNASRITANEHATSNNAEKIGDVEKRLDEDEKKIKSNADSIASAVTRISANEASIASNASNISTVSAKTDSNSDRITALENATPQGSGATSEEITAMKADIKTNTDDIALLKTQEQTSADDIARLKGDVSTNQSSISKNTQNIANVSKKATQNANAISSAQSSIRKNRDGITTLRTDVDTLKANVATNTQDIATLKSNAGSSSSSSSGGGASVSEIMNKIYPVGSIYMTTADVDPATIFGGTWERIKDRFLLAAGEDHAPGETGGAESVQLTLTEIPNHEHDEMYASKRKSYDEEGTEIQIIPPQATYPNNEAYHVVVEKGGVESWNGAHDYHTGWVRPQKGPTWDEDDTDIVQSRGWAHENMPPYLAVHCWQRLTL